MPTQSLIITWNHQQLLLQITILLYFKVQLLSSYKEALFRAWEEELVIDRNRHVYSPSFAFFCVYVIVGRQVKIEGPEGREWMSWKLSVKPEASSVAALHSISSYILDNASIISFSFSILSSY